MNFKLKYGLLVVVLAAFSTIVSCEEFLTKSPLSSPSLETFWETDDQAEMWVNNLYNGLGGIAETMFEAYSDNAFGRAGGAANSIANGTFGTNDGTVNAQWNYRYIRLSLEFFENIESVPDISQTRKNQLEGQVHFMLAYQYYRLITLFRDVPLVTRPLNIDESDVPKSQKEEVLAYILEQLEIAVDKLPESWPASETGRVTKGAALALKSRVLLFNERWADAADAAQQLINMNKYELHPNFGELFLADFNNRTNEVILARQYAEEVNIHSIVRNYAPVMMAGFALILPTPQLEESFQMIDGLPINESAMFNENNRFENRDPRYYYTFLYPGQDLNGIILDLTGTELNFARTYIYYRKYIADLENRVWQSHVNWILFRYAEVLLNYAEARNEASGPDNSVYEALNKIRERAGMPEVDRNRYNTKESLRELIRNERRVELAGEGLRYFDIIRWRIAEDTMNINLTSLDLENWIDGPLEENGEPLLRARAVETRTFNPDRNYVWPIPQDAIDRSDNILVQHPEW